MKSTKYFSVLVLLLLSLLLITFSFAYWAGEVNGFTLENYENTIQIGAGTTVETELKLTDFSFKGTLVPKGQETENTVSSITVPVKVNWTGEGAQGAKGLLKVSGKMNTHSELFSVTAESVNVVNGEEATVIVTLSFDKEPSSKEVYDQLANKALKVLLNFEVEVID